MLDKLIDDELKRIGLIKSNKNLPFESYFKNVNDVIQMINIEFISDRSTKVFFDIIPMCTDKNYFGRTWEYELKKMRTRLSILDMDYDATNSSNCTKEIIDDINKYIKPIFSEFDKTEKMMKLLIMLDNKIYGFDVYADYRKLAVALKSNNYEYAMFILLHLKYDYIARSYRIDLTRCVDFKDIDLKKYTSFDYIENDFIKEIDTIISAIKENNISYINQYLVENQRNIFKYI